MKRPTSPASRIPLTHLALAGVLAVVLLNLLLRSFVRLGGLPTTLLVAAAVPTAMALCFAWRNRRAPSPGERRRLLWLYGGTLGLLYLGLLALMALKDAPSPMGLAIVVLHYLSYPLFAWLLFSTRLFSWFR